MVKPRPVGSTTGSTPAGDDAPVYVISAAAELSGMHPQTLRQYDRLGLVSPDRTPGRGRRYSPRDIGLLREIQRLSQDEGVNLAGIKRIRELQDEVARLNEQVSVLERQLAAALATTIPLAVPGQAAPPTSSAAAAGGSGSAAVFSADLLPAVPAFGRSTALVVWKPPLR